MKHTMVVGTSEPQDFQLEDDNANLDGSGWDVDIEFRTGGEDVTVAWLNQAAGTVRVSGLEDLAAGIYYFRFTLTDGSSLAYVPSTDPVTLRVVPV